MDSLNNNIAYLGGQFLGNGNPLSEDQINDMKCKKCNKKAIYFANKFGEECLYCQECGDERKEKYESLVSMGMGFIKKLKYKKEGKLYYIPVSRYDFSGEEYKINGQFWHWQKINEDTRIMDVRSEKFKSKTDIGVPVSFDNFSIIIAQMLDLNKHTGTLANNYFFSQDYPFDRPDTSCIYVVIEEKCGCCDKNYGKMVPLKDVKLDEKSYEHQKKMWDKCDALIIGSEHINFAEL